MRLRDSSQILLVCLLLGENILVAYLVQQYSCYNIATIVKSAYKPLASSKVTVVKKLKFVHFLNLYEEGTIIRCLISSRTFLFLIST